MSVEVVIGRAGACKTFTLLQRMRTILRESPFSTKIIFLLPAYQTYRAELELAELTGGAVNTVMCNFQHFARQILDEVGGSVIPRISEIGRRIILRNILRRNSKELFYYRKAADQRGFTDILAQELKELRTYSIDANKLRQDFPFDNELKYKLHDIALVAEKFRTEIEGQQNDESDLLEKATELLKNSASIKQTEVFIDGFIFFDPQQRNLLREIIRYAKNVCIALPMDTDMNSRENIMDVGIFNRAFETFKFIRSLVGDEIKITRLDTPRRFKGDALNFLEKNLFARSYKKFSGKGDDIKISEAVNKRVEAEAVARDILKIHDERGIRFRDIGVIFRDDSYSELIKPIFEIHKIPFYVDTKRAASNHPLAELIRSLMEVLRTWRAEPIFRCLRTGFFNVEIEEIDLLENYVLEFGLRGKKIWASAEAWNYYRCNLGEKVADSEIERAGEVDEIRRRALQAITNFSSAIDAAKKNSATTRDFVQVLFEFLEELNLYDKLLEMSEREENRGNLTLAKEHLKIWDDVINLFDQVVEASGDEPTTTKELEYLINEGLDALEMSLIPPSLDAVTVAQFDQNSLQNSRAIYVMGFGDEFFPRKIREKLLLSDADRLHLNDAGIEISLGGNEGLLAEKFLVYRGLTAAREYLHISYPLANVEGKAMRPSPFVDRLKNFFPQVKIELIKLDVLENLGAAGNYTLVEPKSSLAKDTAVHLYSPEKKMRSSVTRLEEFNECPFKYFAEHGLHLEERREYKLTAPDVGNILHGIMRQFGEDLKAENLRWAEVDSEEIEERVTKILDEFTPQINNKILLSTKTLQNQRARIKKVAVESLKRLTDLDRRSHFHPELFEATFAELSKAHLVYDINGVDMELTGRVDRIDFSEDGKYFLVIDYKTGQAYLNLWEIYMGVNLQLLTYMLVTNRLHTDAERLPAAMLYYFLKYPTKSGETPENAQNNVDKSLKMSGYVIDDKKILLDIDGTLEALPVKLTTRGNFDSHCIGNVKSAEDIAALLRHVENCLQETGRKILAGDIAASPFKTKEHDACKYCVYGAVCRLDKKLNVISEPALTDAQIMDAMSNR